MRLSKRGEYGLRAMIDLAAWERTTPLVQIKDIAERPTLEELRERLHKRKPVSVRFDTARMVREEREAR